MDFTYEVAGEHELNNLTYLGLNKSFYLYLKQHFQLYLNFLFAKYTTWSLANLGLKYLF
jgi:hypothetical protein